MSTKPKFIEQLRPYAEDAEAYGRLWADLQDIVEASEWLLSAVRKSDENVLTPDQLESLLIEIDVNFIQHVTYHFKTLRRDLK